MDSGHVLLHHATPLRNSVHETIVPTASNFVKLPGLALWLRGVELTYFGWWLVGSWDGFMTRSGSWEGFIRRQS